MKSRPDIVRHVRRFLLCAYGIVPLLLVGSVGRAEPMLEPAATNEIAACLRQGTTLELPRRAAALLTKSEPRHHRAMALQITTLAIRLNPAATAPIVSAVAKAAPECVAEIAEAAVSEQPRALPQVVPILVLVNPDAARQVILAVNRGAPNQYQTAACAAAAVAPAAGRQILGAVGDLDPELKPFLEAEMRRYLRLNPPVDLCLERAERARALVRSVAPPAPGKVKPNPPRGNGNPPGGRNYARP